MDNYGSFKMHVQKNDHYVWYKIYEYVNGTVINETEASGEDVVEWEEALAAAEMANATDNSTINSTVEEPGTVEVETSEATT